MKKIFLFILCTIPLLVACSDEEFDIPSDSQKAILGKWKVIESGTENGLKKVSDDVVIFFHADGTYEIKMNGKIESSYPYQQTYRIDSVFLYRGSIVDGEPSSKENEFVQKHVFYKNKLRLEYVSGNILDIMGFQPIHIYKRID